MTATVTPIENGFRAVLDGTSLFATGATITEAVDALRTIAVNQVIAACSRARESAVAKQSQPKSTEWTI